MLSIIVTFLLNLTLFLAFRDALVFLKNSHDHLKDKVNSLKTRIKNTEHLCKENNEIICYAETLCHNNNMTFSYDLLQTSFIRNKKMDFLFSLLRKLNYKEASNIEKDNVIRQILMNEELSMYYLTLLFEMCPGRVQKFMVMLDNKCVTPEMIKFFLKQDAEGYWKKNMEWLERKLKPEMLSLIKNELKTQI